MLILKVFVNQRQIDEVEILNTGTITPLGHLYEIRKPITPGIICHDRRKGWIPLVIDALSCIRRCRKAGDREEKK